MFDRQMKAKEDSLQKLIEMLDSEESKRLPGLSIEIESEGQNDEPEYSEGLPGNEAGSADAMIPGAEGEGNEMLQQLIALLKSKKGA